MPLIHGTNLTPEQREEVKERFVNRHLAIPSVYANDDEWINQHYFYIDKTGHLSRVRRNCVPYGAKDERW